MTTVAAPDPRDAQDDGSAFDGEAAWANAALAAALLAVDPVGLGGACIRSAAGPVRDLWLAGFRSLAPDRPFRKIPYTIDEDRLIGGLDLAATLSAGRPVAHRGVLAEADGGVALLSMAERAAPAVAAPIAAALDDGAVRVERDGVSTTSPARFSLLMLDEGAGADETAPEILRDRVAFWISLDAIPLRDAREFLVDADAISAAQTIDVAEASDALVEAINAAALANGVRSLRALRFCLAAARAAAALRGAAEIDAEDARLACGLVLGPRAAGAPPPPPQESRPPETPDQTEGEDGRDHESAGDDDASAGPLDERLIDAVQTAAAAEALALLAGGEGVRRGVANAGKSGNAAKANEKGRVVGVRAGDPRRDGRLDLAATLRAAAPWQKLRGSRDRRARLKVLPTDFHVREFEQRMESVVIFVVDASGSAAMNRMAEAKGAVERLLSDCYSRRDHVCLIAFRGERAEMVLPATRSLVRARRSLAGVPGGGATPLASAIASAAAAAEAEQARGRTPYIVFLSDGRGNIGLDGAPGREAAAEDAARCAKRLRAGGWATLFFDISQRPAPRAQALSAEMGARYAHLPRVDGARISAAVRQTMDDD